MVVLICLRGKFLSGSCVSIACPPDLARFGSWTWGLASSAAVLRHQAQFRSEWARSNRLWLVQSRRLKVEISRNDIEFERKQQMKNIAWQQAGCGNSQLVMPDARNIRRAKLKRSAFTDSSPRSCEFPCDRQAARFGSSSRAMRVRERIRAASPDCEMVSNGRLNTDRLLALALPILARNRSGLLASAARSRESLRQ